MQNFSLQLFSLVTEMSDEVKTGRDMPNQALADIGEGRVIEMTGTKEATLDYQTDNVFSDPAVAEHWRNVYERAKYESRHRFDPDFTWSPQSEVLLKRKVIRFHYSLPNG